MKKLFFSNLLKNLHKKALLEKNQFIKDQFMNELFMKISS
jgi:hypothetical protein